ncbi:DUF6993 domain-containing protein [Arthrobacter sp. TWP1-1]|uniref:DUF6993 domain-containing protein n=1 Tax=Arthrobacter sp. TWP1-1 TaxID=2804568 RepID=UPI003CFB8582
MSVRAVGMTALLATSMILGGCSLLPTAQAPATSAPAAGPTTVAPEDAPSAPAETTDDTPPEAKTAAQELQEKVSASLTSLAAGTKSPNREQMMQAMIEAGAVQENVEISVDITPTGLAVDAIETATLVAKECVVGQVRGGEVAVTILPVLASGRCFVGDVH